VRPERGDTEDAEKRGFVLAPPFGGEKDPPCIEFERGKKKSGRGKKKT
jgi:hypothetical protein